MLAPELVALLPNKPPDAVPPNELEPEVEPKRPPVAAPLELAAPPQLPTPLPNKPPVAVPPKGLAPEAAPPKGLVPELEPPELAAPPPNTALGSRIAIGPVPKGLEPELALPPKGLAPELAPTPKSPPVADPPKGLVPGLVEGTPNKPTEAAAANGLDPELAAPLPKSPALASPPKALAPKPAAALPPPGGAGVLSAFASCCGSSGAAVSARASARASSALEPFGGQSRSLASDAAPLAAVAPLVLALGLASARRLRHRRLRGRDGRLRGSLAARMGDEDRQVQVKEKENEDLEFMRRRNMEAADLELLEASGANKLMAKEEAYRQKKEFKKQNPTMWEKYENDMGEFRNDLERRRLYGDLKMKSGSIRRLRGNRVKEKEQEIKMNRGFPVEDTVEANDKGMKQDKEWMDMWRATWPSMEAVDPHDPESFGFAFVGEVTGCHGLHGDVRVRADEDLCAQGWDPAAAFKRRAFTNWTEDSKRIHIKAPHRRFPRPYRILQGKPINSRVYSLRLEGVETIEDAMALKGYKLYMLEPPPGVDQERILNDPDFSGYGLYDETTTTFHTRDALEMVGAKCHMVVGDASDQVLVDFACAETKEQAKQILEASGCATLAFGDLSAVVPDYKIVKKKASARKAAADLLDITLLPDVRGGEGKWLYEADPESKFGKYMNLSTPKLGFERVVYVPFVPDMIARVEADVNGQKHIYFTLPQGHLEATSFTCRKRITNEQGLLVLPRSSDAKALLPPPGKSHALRRRDGKVLPLHGTAPAPPADMLSPPGRHFEDLAPGVPVPAADRGELKAYRIAQAEYKNDPLGRLTRPSGKQRSQSLRFK
mmetsp:Transcript_74557/g.210236  ORF Transcript_74557/g.210236 Transcript_74557/m.210236 type:complete len:831 (-) Transcript_74557:50-2542(-)